MRFALIGYGKMGKMIESLVKESNAHEIVFIANTTNHELRTTNQLTNCDAVIDFSIPSAVMHNAEMVLDAGKPLIIGTTGWYEQMDELKNLCEKKNGCVVYGSNFSTGVNLFFALNDFMAKLMKTQKNYSTSIDETHHTQKKDAPSGTAITLANSILGNRKFLKQWKLLDEAGENDLPILSHRIGEVIGEHKVIYKSAHDEIQISHSAFDRKGFAEGAIVAAEWAQGKKGFYSFRDVVKDMLRAE